MLVGLVFGLLLRLVLLLDEVLGRVNFVDGGVGVVFVKVGSGSVGVKLWVDRLLLLMGIFYLLRWLSFFLNAVVIITIKIFNLFKIILLFFLRHKISIFTFCR